MYGQLTSGLNTQTSDRGGAVNAVDEYATVRRGLEEAEWLTEVIVNMTDCRRGNKSFSCRYLVKCAATIFSVTFDINDIFDTGL